MWIFTPIGFFSVVRADPERIDGIPVDVPYVMVRARVREDLKNLRALWEDLYEGEPPEILQWKGRDYPYRVLLPQDEWAYICEALATDIDYPNFKSRVTQTQGWERHQLYAKVWGVMNNAEEKLKGKARWKKGKKGRRASHGVSLGHQSSLDRWLDRNGYDPELNDLAGIDWDAPHPAGDLPEGTDTIIDPSDESEPKASEG